MKQTLNQLAGLVIGLAMVGCGSKTFQLADGEASFISSTKSIAVPIDILWVIDNSGSMETSQQQVATNVSAFINKFKNTNFDFRIAVTTTAAYQALPAFGGNQSWSRFRDGLDTTSHTGVHVIDPSTPNLESVFQTNILQGILGSADERGFQSLEATLLNAQNAASFPRVGSFLAVIFLTDEEDFSWDGTANLQLNPDGSPANNQDPRLHPISRYVDMLDAMTNSTPDKRNYSFNTIAIFSEQCRQQLSTSFSGRRIADRYAALTDATGGVKAELCDDFSEILQDMTDSILIKTTKFYLTRKPKPESIQVLVNDVAVPAEGWVYDSVENSISFSADHIPDSNANVRIRFQPMDLIN